MTGDSGDLPRRRLLRAGATLTALGVLGSFAGCQQRFTGDSGPTGIDRVGLVPAEAEFVAGVDVTGMLETETFRETVNGTLAPYAGETGGPTDIEGALDQVETETGLDPRKLSEVLTFGVLDGESPAGAVLWSEWDQTAFFDAIRESSEEELSESTYGDRTVLTVEDGREPHQAITSLTEDGVFVVADTQSVETVLNLWDGESENAVGGDVEEAYTAPESGLARFGFDVPTEQIPEETSGPVDLTPLREVTYGYGSLDEDSSLTVTLQASGEEQAQEIRSTLTGLITLAETSLQEGSQQGEPADRALELLDAISVTKQDDTVVVDAGTDSGTSVLALLGSVLGSFVLGIGAQQTTQQSAPQVAFEFDYVAEARELRITHAGGEPVPAAELFVRGDGVETSRWDRLGGSASQTNDGQSQVVAGDRLTLSEVPSDYKLRLVWEPADADRSVTLAMAEGPEA